MHAETHKKRYKEKDKERQRERHTRRELKRHTMRDTQTEIYALNKTKRESVSGRERETSRQRGTR